MLQQPVAEPDVQRAQEHFAEAGFEVTPAVATSFSIVGPAEAFERTFAGFDAAAAADPDRELALDLDAVPGYVKAVVDTVVIEGPLDYGPGNP